MKVCIIGQGASGWMAASFLSTMKIIDEIILIGSPEIKTIGVGESNTCSLNFLHSRINASINDFVSESDAAVKLGVYYQNWGGTDFIHYFKNSDTFFGGFSLFHYFNCLTNKSDNTPITDLIGQDLQAYTKHNLLPLGDMNYHKSWHFDAAKYISFLEKFNKDNQKLTCIKDTVIDCNFISDGELGSIVLKSGRIIESDYFVFASGSSDFLETKLGEKYESLSEVLLTNKAVVYPLPYENKRNQFHPYTVAKTMNCGWRWITPTYSRIGTGYVFSENHISIDEAVNEFLDDIGDHTINPTVVDFSPRFNKKTFKGNYCTIGMANGFLEPLDAPGLSTTINTLAVLENLLLNRDLFGEKSTRIKLLTQTLNYEIELLYQKWASFILTQYKTSSSRFNEFWNDHRDVKYKFLDEYLISLKYNATNDLSEDDFAVMFYHTMAAKNYHWDPVSDYIPEPQDVFPEQLEHHLDYIDKVRSGEYVFVPD